jgi:hypothetical protein
MDGHQALNSGRQEWLNGFTITVVCTQAGVCLLAVTQGQVSKETGIFHKDIQKTQVKPQSLTAGNSRRGRMTLSYSKQPIKFRKV